MWSVMSFKETITYWLGLMRRNDNLRISPRAQVIGHLLRQSMHFPALSPSELPNGSSPLGLPHWAYTSEWLKATSLLPPSGCPRGNDDVHSKASDSYCPWHSPGMQLRLWLHCDYTASLSLFTIWLSFYNTRSMRSFLSGSWLRLYILV